jgi:flagellar M-ring protein FliF
MALQPQAYLNTLSRRLGALSTNRKIGLAITLAAAIAVLVGLVLWTRAPEYRVLFSNLEERDAGAVVVALQQMNVPYKTGPGGTILVPSDQVYDLRFRLAGQGLPRGGAVGFELMDNTKLGMTQFQEQVTYQRALEGELARTVQSLAPVESARVHLAIPKPSVFIREQEKPSASVLVTLYAGRSLDPAQVSAIVHLVSSSVPNLNPSQVTVVDQSGSLLTASSETSAAQGLNASQLDYLRQVDDYYARRIEAIVSPMVGDGNVKADVRADLDFSVSELTSETYKPNPTPDSQAIRSQQSVADLNSGAGPAAGVPGAFSNRPPGPATAPFNAPPGANAGPNTAPTPPATTSSRKESTVNYELDKTIKHVQEPLGRIKRLSAAVVVNYRSVAGEGGQAQAKPLSPQELAQVNSLVKEAMGFNQERGDTVNVVNAAFTETKVEAPSIPIWKDPENIALAKELLKYLVILGLTSYFVFGVLRPLLRDLVRTPEPVTPEGGQVRLGERGEMGMPEAGPPGKGRPGTYEHVLGDVKEFAKQNPKVTADIVKQWIAKE